MNKKRLECIKIIKKYIYINKPHLKHKTNTKNNNFIIVLYYFILYD